MNMKRSRSADLLLFLFKFLKKMAGEPEITKMYPGAGRAIA